jgi:uncharacterized protein (DUF362 family)
MATATCRERPTPKTLPERDEFPEQTVKNISKKTRTNSWPAKGELREPNLILVSGNQAAIDVEGVKILQSYPGNSLGGKNVRDLIQIKSTVELGLGPYNEEEYQIITP